MTMTMLVLCWATAALAAGLMLYSGYRKNLSSSLIGYFGIGFFGIALPFKLALDATSILGMMFLSVAWPIWMALPVVGVSPVDVLPMSFISLLFNF